MTTTMTVAMLALAGVCWLFRIAFIVLVPAERLPPRVRRAMGHLAPAVLAALVTVEITTVTDGSNTWSAAYVLAALALVALVVRRTRSMLLAITVSAVAALLLDLVLSRLA